MNGCGQCDPGTSCFFVIEHMGRSLRRPDGVSSPSMRSVPSWPFADGFCDPVWVALAARHGGPHLKPGRTTAGADRASCASSSAQPRIFRVQEVSAEAAAEAPVAMKLGHPNFFMDASRNPRDATPIGPARYHAGFANHGA